MIEIRRILHPSDSSDCSTLAFEYASEFATQFDAEFHLLHVCEVTIPVPLPPDYVRELMDLAGKDLDRIAESDAVRDLDVVKSVRCGPPFVEIVRYAQTHHIDLIVMGTHGRGAIAHALLGSIAEKVVRKAPCPVLTVRPEGHEFIHPVEAALINSD